MMIFNSRDRECVVTLSEAKGLSRSAARSFASLRMTELDLAVGEKLSSAFEPCLTLNGEMLPLMLWRRNYSMRRTKIVCTIGPATNSEAQLEQLMRAGMNVARLNFSHGAQQDHALVIERIRAISTRLVFPIAILQDLQGPKIRVGALKDGTPVKLVDGATLTITVRDIAGTSEIVSTTYKLLPQDLKPGDRILLDDGLMELRVLGSSETDVQCVVVHGGMLKEHKGINLPGVAVSAPALTEKDRADVKFGVTHDVDYVALSFVRKPQDVLEAQRLIAYLQAQQSGRHRHPLVSIPLIAKLEKPEAVAHLDEILEVVDGVMVARGD